MNLGILIRKYRKEKGLTLKAVAEVAGISEGFLSQVENNVNSPSIDTLKNICNALGIKPSNLLAQIEKQESIAVIRKSEWKEIELPFAGFATRRFFPPENRTAIDSAILVIESGKSIPVRKNIKNSQEVISILKGSAELVYGKQLILLKAGDSVHYWSIPEQKISNNGDEPTIVLWVSTL